MISQNITTILKRIQVAAESIGKTGKDIALIAVTKTVPVKPINESIESGIQRIGENKIQEAIAKQPLVHKNVAWHLIGHLQKNKAKKAVQLFDMIQSLDTIRLGDAINRHAADAQKTIKCLVEVKISEEETKQGIKPEHIDELLAYAVQWQNIDIVGLMTIAPYSDDPQNSRPFFKRMKQLFESIKARHIPHIRMDVLSMGMSNDFEIAIQEGSTMVRIGTAIYGERQYKQV